MKQAQIEALIDRINAFDRRTFEDQYTDTGEAWDLFNKIRAELRQGLDQNVREAKARFIISLFEFIAILLAVALGIGSYFIPGYCQ